MVRYRPPSIREEGLDHHLNRTKDKHNGLGSKEFHTLHNAGVNLHNIGKAFKVSRNTIVKWLQVDKERQAKADAEVDELGNV